MKNRLCALSLLSVVALPAAAQNFYVFAGIEQNKVEADLGGFNISKTDNGYAIGVGHTFNNSYALEFSYRDLFTLSNNSVYEDYEFKSTSEATALQLSLLGNYPLNPQLSIFGRLGVGRITVKGSEYENDWGSVSRGSSNETETKALLGIGMRYALTQNLGTRLEYSRFAKIEETTLSTLSLALDYQF